MTNENKGLASADEETKEELQEKEGRHLMRKED
jgi:hypothetical protein